MLLNKREMRHLALGRPAWHPCCRLDSAVGGQMSDVALVVAAVAGLGERKTRHFLKTHFFI